MAYDAVTYEKYAPGDSLKALFLCRMPQSRYRLYGGEIMSNGILHEQQTSLA